MSDHWDKYSPDLRRRRKDYMEKAGITIKTLRKNAKVTQGDAGNLIEVTRQEISRYESGVVDMPYSALPVLIEDMGGSLYDIMRGLLPRAKHEFELCRDILLDLIEKSGISTSAMDPFFPKKAIYPNYLTLQEAHQQEEAYVLHDPVVSVLDSINLVSIYGTDEEVKTVKFILLKSIVKHMK